MCGSNSRGRETVMQLMGEPVAHKRVSETCPKVKVAENGLATNPQESPCAVARACYGVHVWLHRDMVQCVSSRLLSCPVYVVFVFGALRWVLQGRSHSLPPDLTTLRSGTPGRTVGEEADVRKETAA